MNIEETLKRWGDKNGLAQSLQITFHSTPEPDTLMARMPVGDHNCQSYGYLNGGASLALAENVAGVASWGLCPNELALGQQVSGNHIRPAEKGDEITAIAHIIHKGRHSHVWQVELTRKDGKTVCIATVTNYIMPWPKK